MIQVPNKLTNPPQTWTQPNTSDALPNIWASKNIDLTFNEDKVRLGRTLLVNTGTSDVSQITSYPVGFRVFNNGSGQQTYTVAGLSGTGYVFTNSVPLPYANFTRVVTAGAPTTCDSYLSDIELGFGELYVTANESKVYYLNSGGTWNSITSNSPGGVGYANMLTFFANRMYCTKNGYKINSWDSAHTVAADGAASTLALDVNDDSIDITFLRSSSSRIWIGTVNKVGGKGYIYEWDGASTQATKSYRLESSGALACVIKDDIPYVMDANGSLLVWNGGTFKTIASLNRRQQKILFNPFYKTNQRFIHPNGMSIIKGKINILIDGTNYDATAHGGTQEETIPSGIWEYDANHGLYHKSSIGLVKTGSSGTDFGQFKINGVGGLSELVSSQSYVDTDGTLICGASYYTDATTSTSAIFYDNFLDTKQKGGYIVTNKIYSPNITEIWQSLFYRYRKLLGSTDKIVVKYRTEEAEPTEMVITWSTVGASTTTFTTTDANIVNYAVGDEIEGLRGTGAGRCSHIVSISAPSAGTYTVVVDEVYTGATGTARIRLQKWIKTGFNIYGDTHPYFNNIQMPLTATTTWIQFKVFMIFTGRGELENLNIQTKQSQSSNK